MNNIKKIIFIVVIIWFVFAYIPDYLGYSPGPTGGWDWLNFMGVIIGFYGVIVSIEEEREKSKNELTELNKPFLDINLLENYNGKRKIYRKFEIMDGILVNNGWEIRDYSPECSNCFQLKNIGLSTATEVCIFLYRLDSVQGLNKLDDIMKIEIENFYDKLAISKYKFFENTNKKHECWQIYPAFNLSNNYEKDVIFEFEVEFAFSEEDINFHNILEFRFKDLFENEYYQLMYFTFNKKNISYHPISKVYRGKEFKNKK